MGEMGMLEAPPTDGGLNEKSSSSTAIFNLRGDVTLEEGVLLLLPLQRANPPLHRAPGARLNDGENSPAFWGFSFSFCAGVPTGVVPNGIMLILLSPSTLLPPGLSQTLERIFFNRSSNSFFLRSDSALCFRSRSFFCNKALWISTCSCLSTTSLGDAAGRCTMPSMGVEVDAEKDLLGLGGYFFLEEGLSSRNCFSWLMKLLTSSNVGMVSSLDES
mmetsp:Transcript_16177/g.29331  ORF Transcript_16177/g.29331 Transcript_16177/m.29331 type:complete len:217 (+) Transcript_16177:185-835(+)